ncbi:DUF1631 family protein [Lampropedia cohaerens]|uniref:DUF1631 family protein n=1 Tax=Lampropedia cohaerens TaxID=1610491 RepID=UPI00069A65D3|nr:DUF1631 family protein [Lampropedia cohaerens]
MNARTVSDSQSLARVARQTFLQSLCSGIAELDRLITRAFDQHLAAASGSAQLEPLPLDQWAQQYMRSRRDWAQALLATWRAALTNPDQPVAQRKSLETAQSIDELQLISDEAIEGLIASSRLSMQVADSVDPAFIELRRRLHRLGEQRLSPGDVILPATVAENIVQTWLKAGLSKPMFIWLMQQISQEWAAILLKAYQAANQFLEDHGIAPLVPQPVAAAPRSGHGSLAAAGAAAWAGTAGPQAHPPHSQDARSPNPVQPGVAVPTGMAMPAPVFLTQPAASGFLAPQMVVPGAPMPATTPLQAPQARFGQQVLQQVQALQQSILARMSLVLGAGPGGVQPAPSTALAHALQAQQVQAIAQLEQVAAGTTFIQSPAAVGQQLVRVARQQSEAIKQQANQPNEKAIIEMVALMFQSVLSEDRVPASLRVLFARLQVPVLRVALSDADFFTNAEHPIKRLIDRMGSAAMGFDGANFQGSALESEIRRIVQMIEQYPDTGVKVFQLALNEFEKFLQKHLSEHRLAGKAISVAQQIEEKETLLVRFTIELRRLLQDLPIKEEIRSFLFKTWAEVLAVSAIRSGPKSTETRAFKRAASLLIWVTSAKTTSRERRRAVQALPQLLARLRAGLALVGVLDVVQDAAVAKIQALVQEAFLSRAQGLSASQLRQLAGKLENLENLVGNASAGDIPLSREHIEMVVGIELPGLTVVEPQADEQPAADVLAWADARTIGEWFHFGTGAQQTDSEDGLRVQYAWHSQHRQLHLLVSNDGRSFLMQRNTLAACFERGTLVPLDQEGLMLRATRVALTQYQATDLSQAVAAPPASTEVPHHPMPDDAFDATMVVPLPQPGAGPQAGPATS